MQDNRIPLAWSVRWRRIRSQAIPATTFVLALVASAVLWREHGAAVQGVGEVSSSQVDVTSPAAGLVIGVSNQSGGHWTVYDRVEAGDVLARIEEQQPEPGKTVEILAPISGTLVSLKCAPGQTVMMGTVLATIAADRGGHIIGFIPEGSKVVPEAGMRVVLRPRVPGGAQWESKIEKVGSQIEKVPSHQRSLATQRQWGTAVRIKMPDEAALQPGALVDLMIHR